MVCAGDLTLKGAQHEIATDWRAALQEAAVLTEVLAMGTSFVDH
jgi:hypothetical protein